MFDHVTIRVSDREAARRFYTTVLGEPSYAGAAFDEWKDFSLTEADAEHPVTRHLHVAFAAPSREDVDAFWQRGIDAGYPSDGEPGLRPQYTPDYYGGFLLDPDGNSVEACTGFREGAGGPPIDHLWLGVRDLAASRRFWETVARGGPLAGRTELFVTPGFEFRRVDALVTNFHLPRSTLLALVMAFAGVEETRGLYRLAIEEGYRFYSFGDAMLVK